MQLRVEFDQELRGSMNFSSLDISFERKQEDKTEEDIYPCDKICPAYIYRAITCGT